MNCTEVGFFGDGIRGDCRVTIADAGKAELAVESTVEAMYGRLIRDQVQETLDRHGNPNLSLRLQDAGALPWVINARLEAALCRHLGLDLPPVQKKARSVLASDKRRTRLYVPGNTPKFITHVGLFGSDGVILDLEDSVPELEKFAALCLVRHAIGAIDFGRSEIGVRIHDIRDVRVVAEAGAECIYVPKVEDPEQVVEVVEALRAAGSDAKVIAILESALGVVNAHSIASSSERLVAISLGIEDYLTDIHAVRTQSRTETMFAHGAVINAARAARVVPLGSVFSHIDDLHGMSEYCRWAKSMGYDGVGCVHPSQIAPAMAAFRPTPEALEEAEEVVRAFEEAQKQGIGAIRVRGKMVDAPIYERARAIIAEAAD